MCEEESEYNAEPAKKTYTSQPWSTIKKQLTMMFVCKEVRFEENYIDSKTRRTILWSATMAWCIIQWKVLVQNRTSKQHQMLHHTFILNYLQSQAFSLWSLASTGIPIILSGFAMSQRRRIARSVSCKGQMKINWGWAEWGLGSRSLVLVLRPATLLGGTMEPERRDPSPPLSTSIHAPFPTLIEPLAALNANFQC